MHTPDGGGVYTFLNIKKVGPSAEETQNLFLNEAGVATTAGTSFGNSGEGGPRFSYVNNSENILQAV